MGRREWKASCICSREEVMVVLSCPFFLSGSFGRTRLHACLFVTEAVLQLPSLMGGRPADGFQHFATGYGPLSAH